MYATGTRIQFVAKKNIAIIVDIIKIQSLKEPLYFSHLNISCLSYLMMLGKGITLARKTCIFLSTLWTKILSI